VSLRRECGTFCCQSKLPIAFGCGNLDGNKRFRIFYCTAPPPSRIDRARLSKAVCGSGILATVGATRTSVTAARARDLVRPHGFAELVIQRLDRTGCIGQRLIEITVLECQILNLGSPRCRTSARQINFSCKPRRVNNGASRAG
jgi:hypothetical protein